MVKRWQEIRLEEENRNLRDRLRACLELIDDLSNLDAPLFEANVSREFKLKYVRTISRARKSLKRIDLTP